MKNSKKQYLVVGLGNFGKSIALTLEDLGCDVIAIDSDESLVQDMSNRLTYVVCGNAANEKTLAALEANNVDVAIVAIRDLQASILTTLQLKDMGVSDIIVKATNDLHGKILEKIGASHIVYPERDTARRLANRLFSNTIGDYVAYHGDTGLLQISVPKELIGKNLIEANLRKRFNVNVIYMTSGQERIPNPDPTVPLQEGDTIVLFGTNTNLDEARRSLG